MWSNGDDFTAEDVIVTFNARRLSKGTVWRFLESVEAVDDHTVVFTMSEPSTVVERYVIRNEYIVDRATFSEWSDKVQALVDEGLDNDPTSGTPCCWSSTNTGPTATTPPARTTSRSTPSTRRA